MSKIIKIGICNSSADKIRDVGTIKVESGKGIVGDRHHKDINDIKKQITIIESEKIDFYNTTSNTSFNYLDFRRNLVTRGLSLNKLLNKEFFIGSIKVKAYDYCKPCLHLQKILKRNDIIKKFVDSGGLRCKILNDGNISVGDLVKK
jgi:MOSC domain-containing protein YiiM